jgi:hypothetical protein
LLLRLEVFVTHGEPSNDDEDTINAIVLLEDRGIGAIPTDDSDKRIKHDNTSYNTAELWLISEKF